jgi:hypothetical protein
LLVLGTLLMTRRQGYEPADAADRRRRIAMRLAVLVPLLCVLVRAAGNEISRQYVFGINDADVSLGCVSLLAGAVWSALMFFQFRSLAKRARSAHLAEHCAIVGTGSSVSLLYACGIILLTHSAEQLGLGSEWDARSDSFLIIMLIMSVAARKSLATAMASR